jgi:UDP-2,4-diacetamido-2,4,6-trideoxy-beta-L-altropyranose hydrolase
MKKKIRFRADGSANIGLGHLYRCISLAEMLKENFEIFFYTTTESDLFSEVNSPGFQYVKLEQDTHFEDFLKHLNGDEIVVLDNYYFDAKYMTRIKLIGCLLTVIDDIANRTFNVDLIINTGPGIKKENYNLSSNTKLLLGLDYALLRPAFLKQSNNNEISSNKETFFVCFGGSDSKSLTIETIEFFNQNYPSTILNIVVGKSYTDQDKLNQLIESSPHKINVFSNIKEQKIVDLLQNASFGIVACSSILIEALSTNLPCLGIKYVENQDLIFKYMRINEPNGVYIDSQNEKLEISHINLLKSKEKGRNKLIDLRSGERILNAFLRLSNKSLVKLRTTTIEDVGLYFKWVNDPSVREGSFQSEKIVYKVHEPWFHNKLESEDTRMFTAEINKKPCGEIRFDIKENKAFIGISVAREYRGMGLASEIIQLGIKKFKKSIGDSSIEIIAEIKTSNKKSIKSFKNVNFMETDSKFINGIKSVILSLK